jgi:crossover junction endodeoxyribonuclease RuvC
MVILGIDPGTIVTGYGIIEVRGTIMKLVASGSIRNRTDNPMPARLRAIHDTLRDVIAKFKPDEVAVETAFYGKNAQSALKLGQARGVAILAAVSGDLPLAEYSPREVKKAVVGNGSASKQQVQYMVRSTLGMKEGPKLFDITDALAVAICHTHRRTSTGGRHTGWAAYVKNNPGKIRHTRKR